MAAHWGPEEINRLIVTTTACLCLLFLVVSTMLGISSGVISATLLGSATGIGVGGGLVGLAWVLHSVIRAALAGGNRDG